MTDKDTPLVYVKEESEMAGFDHDPVDRHGHGEHCIPNCAPVVVFKDVPVYRYADGTTITDPEDLARIERVERNGTR